MEDFKKLAQGNKYGVSEKAPKFLYDAMKADDCNVMFARRDRADWKVVMTLDFYEKLIGEKKSVCPTCGRPYP